MPISLAVIEATGIAPGMTVLDIGASTGNTAIAAAQAGAQVVAHSLTSDLVHVAQQRAVQAGVKVE
jgi:2-polyprenyl-3-methyl-5-hydroxy-6-metoxy-1,4-benzoquinol methylase